jgi:hypothetical protein
MSSSPNLTILPTATNPWGWEDDESSSSLNFNDIASLAKVLQDAMDKNTLSEKKTVVVWESLTPLLARHDGLISKTISFLRQLSSCSSSSCLQIWPLRIDSLTKIQHAHLEDIASAVLWLQGGDMTLIRQGIRETGNIVRETLPFRIQIESSSSDGMYYRLALEEENDDEHKEEHQDETPPQDQGTATFVAQTNTRTGTSATSSTRTDETTSAGTVKIRSRTKVQLQIEEEKVETPSPPSAPNTENNRPRIFLQDDDPEFDDLDEEDPDDDLEI